MKDWKGNTQSVMATLNASSHSTKERAELDYYASPKKAVDELLRIEDFYLATPIWECASGENHISSVLTTNGYTVRSSDIINRANNEVYDFLSVENKSWSGHILTNPPFALATDFIEKALEIIPTGNKVAFFLRVQFLEGVRRRKLFDSQPPIRVWVASRTLRCAKNGDFANATGNASTYAWFIWEKNFSGSPTLGWFN